MKLSLTRLEVKSYASQMNEVELTSVKGGSTERCALIAYLNSISLTPVNEEDIKPIIIEQEPEQEPELQA